MSDSGKCLDSMCTACTEEVAKLRSDHQGLQNLCSTLVQYIHDLKRHKASIQFCKEEPCPATLEFMAKERVGACVDDQHRGVECKCCHVILHCCSHHCCCFYRCKCRHAKEHHPAGGPCDFGDGCNCKAYVGE